ncbi:nodulation protein NfeD [Brevibacillus sp. SYP-B805]|uniref:NfeD family protein n=1 Tax=Brevibacillus sp. SYP-B805 TaxID=1578199 RepID=UPI0013EE120F|nr:nodulation protein NfeD [Brevibacillus sp. SYP-B805]NGQ94120.1 nodulation protein NfeD [Brevibacillus sp. SYP-B805]
MARGKASSLSALLKQLCAASLLLLVMIGANPQAAAAAYQKAVWIPVDQEIERGLESFLTRAFAEAEAQGADLVILDIDTPGGEVEAAGNIGQLVRQAPMDVVAFIDNKAFSAGTYIALNADKIAMTPGSSMGAATPVDRVGNAASIKMISAWSDQMVAAAKLNNRNTDIARAMVEIDMDLPPLKKKGTVLSLDADLAKQVGYADLLVADRTELEHALGLEQAQVSEIQPTVGEKIARFVTSPYVMSVLFIIGLVGIAVEIFHPGFGVAGAIGIASFALYFFGHYVAGFANWIHIALFLLGIVMVFLELFLPGGIVGGIGFVSLISGLVLAAYDTRQGLASLGIAVLVTGIVTFVLVKYFGLKGIWQKLTLRYTQQNEAGYVAHEDRRGLAGKAGIALTPMRPAGVVKIEGKRIDAVSAGGFIPAGSAIVVAYVEGTRVVVQEQESDR